MEKVAIISVIYLEPEWNQTERCLDTIDCPKFYVDRKGTGSLAKAINSGFKAWSDGFEYIWFVTNVTFKPDCLSLLVKAMDESKYAGITPAFHSDHLFCRPAASKKGYAPVPFVEFTAPIVRTSVFKKHMLDEDMPYTGHDIDWGYRVRKDGYKVGTLYDAVLGHTYIRNNKAQHPITQKRKELRSQAIEPTKVALHRKYGHTWRRLLEYGGAV